MTNTHRAPVDITHATLSVLFLALLAASTVWVLSPFLTAILWATIITVATWPMLLRLQALLGGRRSLAVAIMTASILLIVFVPVTLALATIVRNAQNISTEITSLEAIPVPVPPPWLAEVPLVGHRVVAKWTTLAALTPEDRVAALTPYAEPVLQWFAAKAGGIGMTLLQSILTAIISAILLAKGEHVRDGVLRFARRLAGQPGHDVALLAGKAIRAVVLGVVVTALLQAAIAGAGLALSGVPAAPLLTAVVLFLCLAQLGPIPVLVPAVAWLYWSGQTVDGTILLVATLVSGALDNVIRPLMIKRGANLPILLIFAGVIGGLMAFGILGLFIGPVVLTVSYTLLSAWVSDGQEGGAPAATPPAPVAP
jgi:predicted PurR-regulated permease PerM